MLKNLIILSVVSVLLLTGLFVYKNKLIDPSGPYEIRIDPKSEVEIKRNTNSKEDLKILDEINDNLLNKTRTLDVQIAGEPLRYYKVRPISIWYSFDNDKGEKFYFVNAVTYSANTETGATEYSLGGHMVFTKKMVDGTWVNLAEGQEAPENILCSTLAEWGVPSKYKCLENASSSTYRSGIEFDQK